jgi:hypothetical protein
LGASEPTTLLMFAERSGYLPPSGWVNQTELELQI